MFDLPGIVIDDVVVEAAGGKETRGAFGEVVIEYSIWW